MSNATQIDILRDTLALCEAHAADWTERSKRNRASADATAHEENRAFWTDLAAQDDMYAAQCRRDADAARASLRALGVES